MYAFAPLLRVKVSVKPVEAQFAPLPLTVDAVPVVQRLAVGLLLRFSPFDDPHTPFTGLSSTLSYVTMSAGLACFPTNGSCASELIENADRALYQAKRQGRNQVVAFATTRK